jgi:ATP-dependent Clp protease ATP-binding subunit ClpC
MLPYSSRLRVCLAISRGIAAARGDTDLTPLHIALGLLRERENSAIAALMHAGVDIDTLRAEIEQALGAPRAHPRQGEVCIGATPGEQRFVELGAEESRRRGDEHLGPQHLLLAIIGDSESDAAAIFARHGMVAADASSHVDAVFMRHLH